MASPPAQCRSDAGLWRSGVTLTGPDHGRDPGVDRDVAGGQPGRLPAEVEVEADSGPEHQAVRRAAEVEHAELVALFYVLSLVHGDLAGGDLGHADCKDAHEPDGRIVGLDEHHRPGGDLGYVALRVVGPGRVGPAGGDSPVQLIGRDLDVEFVCDFVDEAAVRGGALLVSGDAGVGKTALLDGAVLHAEAAGTRVIRAAGAEFEAELGFSGLNVVLHPLLDGLPMLPPLHRQALSVALGLDAGSPSDRLVVSNAVLALLLDPRGNPAPARGSR